MELKKREVVENVNFNIKGEKIKDTLFAEDKKNKKENNKENKETVKEEIAGGEKEEEKADKKEEGQEDFSSEKNKGDVPKKKEEVKEEIKEIVSATTPVPEKETTVLINSDKPANENAKAEAPKEFLRKEKISSATEENSQKGVVVSNKPDTTIAIANGSLSEDSKRNKKGKIWKNFFIIGGVFAFFLILVGIYFGLEAKDAYLTKISLEKVLKGDVQAVFDINSNTDFEQYKYLDDNLRKFPGYKLVEKELDDVGEGKSISEAFQDELAAKNLSFNDDIKPVIGDKILVIIPKLDPLTKGIQKMVLNRGKEAKNALRKMELEGKVADAGQALAFGDIANAGKIKVLGMTSDFYTSTAPIAEEKQEPVDFIIGAEIKSLKDAKRVLEKLKNDKNKYEVLENKFKGYAYYKITQKPQNSEERENSLASIESTYHSLIGQNWIMATSESDLKEMISARKEKHLLSRMAFWKKSKEVTNTLDKDGNYNKIKNNLALQSQEGFASFYLKINPSSITSSPYPESQSRRFFKTPEKDFIVGILARATPGGIVFRTSTNQINFGGVENESIGKGLIEEMPSKAGGRWTDLYSETADLKNFYYNIKKNNLTAEGLKAFDEVREQIKQETGLDPETRSDGPFQWKRSFCRFYCNWGLTTRSFCCRS